MIRHRSPVRKVLGSIALCFLPVLLAHSALFSIRTVEVAGLNDFQRAQVATQVAHLKGRNLLLLSLGEVRGVFSAVGWIRDVEIRKILPGRLQVHLVPRRAVGVWVQGQGEALVDAGGNLFIGDPSDAGGPIITGQSRGGDLRTVAGFLEAEAELAGRLWAVELKADGGIAFIDADGHRLWVDLATARSSLDLFERLVRDCPELDQEGDLDIRRPGRFVRLGHGGPTA